MKEVHKSYFEVKSPDDNYGLMGQFATEDDAIAHINESYRRALELGYDNRHENWVTVCVEYYKSLNDKGEFLKEETIRYVCSSVQFSECENAFVIAV